MVMPSFALRRSWTILNDRLRRTVTRALTERVAGYELKVPNDMTRVYQYIKRGDLGKRYDNRNFIDLTLMLLSPIKFGPLRRRTIETCLGNCTDLQVICSGMIAKAFHRVGYPILSELDIGKREDGKRAETHSAP